MNKITWKCPNHGTFVGDPDENPHSEIEAEQPPTRCRRLLGPESYCRRIRGTWNRYRLKLGAYFTCIGLGRFQGTVDGEVQLWIPQLLIPQLLTEGEAEEELKELEGTGLTPIEIPGDSFDASRNTIQGRLRESKRMVERGPLIMKGLDSNLP